MLRYEPLARILLYSEESASSSLPIREEIWLTPQILHLPALYRDDDIWDIMRCVCEYEGELCSPVGGAQDLIADHVGMPDEAQAHGSPIPRPAL